MGFVPFTIGRSRYSHAIFGTIGKQLFHVLAPDTMYHHTVPRDQRVKVQKVKLILGQTGYLNPFV